MTGDAAVADLDVRAAQLELAATLLLDAAYAVPEGRPVPLLACDTLTGAGERIAHAMRNLDRAQEDLANGAREVSKWVAELAGTAHDLDLALAGRASERPGR